MDVNHLTTEEIPSSSSPGLLKNVQELAIDGEEPPPRYIRKDSDHKEKKQVPAHESLSVPIIDVSRLLPASSGREKEDEMEKLKSALNSWGLFQAIGHSIPKSLLDDINDVSKQFFDLPIEEKQRYTRSEEDEIVDLQGYGSDTIVSDDQVLDWSDRLYLLIQPQEQQKLRLWPDPPSHFRRTLNEYSVKAGSVAEVILKAMARSIGLEEYSFINQLGGQPMVYARFNYYPPCSRPDLVYGIKAHADGGAITILLQDPEVEDLQVLKDDQWISVPCMPGALLINVADQVQIMSNGIFKSPIHRVVTNKERERLYLAMFYGAKFDKEIEPTAGLINESNPRMFRKVKVKDYLEVFFPKYLLGERAIDWAKV
ncbi:hypothetical protein C5167_043453 [Papaver somniferum]|uniref:Fe2OG dioxygenase domain-containing protein n=1 Tax=Papaver somniferum TaxID=3469 RepID=A0A4Y7L8U1_PAPSO|nr:protein SRG1-like [Papaver somniferum]RZC80878.1 hypothetical protein C5167_043453 [Papaver somniferum]